MIRTGDRELAQERSMVVSGRVDIVKLAEVMAALRNTGHYVRTMSTLISYCVELAHHGLEQNNYIQMKMSGVSQAYYLLTDTGLMTRSMQKRNLDKFNTASRFENLRMEGVDPEIYAPGQYNVVHNNNSVEAPSPLMTRAKAQEMVELLEKTERAKMIADDDARSEVIIANLEYNEDGSVKTLPAYEFRQTPAITAEPTKLGRPPKNPSTNTPVECKPAERLLAPKELRDKLNAMSPEERKIYIDSLKPKKKVKVDDRPRAKTSEELDDKADRIKQKDSDYNALLNANIEPTRTSECSLPQSNE
jgi:hypothetical protein